MVTFTANRRCQDVSLLLKEVLLHGMIHIVLYIPGLEGLILEPSRGSNLFRFLEYGYTRAVGLARRGGELGGKNAPDDHEDSLASFWQR
jgi:hypothetical protein